MNSVSALPIAGGFENTGDGNSKGCLMTREHIQQGDRHYIQPDFLIRAEPICFRVLVFRAIHSATTRFFPNGLDGIIAYIKQAGQAFPCEVKNVFAIDGDLGRHTCAFI